MIIREIREQPELLDHFDWFNDYDDTRRWATHSCPNMTGPLDDGFREYQRKKAQEWKEKQWQPEPGDVVEVSHDKKKWYVRIFVETNHKARISPHRCLSHDKCPYTGKRYDEGPMPDHLDADEHWFPFKYIRKCEPNKLINKMSKST
jgi:hypothetical protein